MLEQKELNLNLQLNRKRKENLTKIKTQRGKLMLKRKFKRGEERCRYIAK